MPKVTLEKYFWLHRALYLNYDYNTLKNKPSKSSRLFCHLAILLTETCWSIPNPNNVTLLRWRVRTEAFGTWSNPLPPPHPTPQYFNLSINIYRKIFFYYNAKNHGMIYLLCPSLRWLIMGCDMSHAAGSAGFVQLIWDLPTIVYPQ